MLCGNGHEFSAEPNSIMSMGSWCPKCCHEQAANNFYTRVTQLKGKLHGIYSNPYGGVLIECDLGHMWNAIPHNVMSNGNWCPVCKESHGERSVRLILDKLNIPFTSQKEHPNLPGRRYDFHFFYNIKEFYLEYDGEQHFTKVDFFCKTDEQFQDRRNTDIRKSHTVTTSGQTMIRLDYTLTDEQLEQHILTAINSTDGNKLYVSNEDLYKWIIDGINPQPIPVTLNMVIPSGAIIPPMHITVNIINDAKVKVTTIEGVRNI